jgi:hypothetical protein
MGEKAVLSVLALDTPAKQYCYDHLITEDSTPVDNWFAEAMYRLLVEPLYASWKGPPGHGGKFIAGAKVGIFPDDSQPLPPVCPDMLLSLGVEFPADIHRKENRSYFLWKFGKPPDAVAEIVFRITKEVRTVRSASSMPSSGCCITSFSIHCSA